MKIINDALGLRLKKLRKFKKMSQVAFGEAVNLSQQAIVGIETGKRETTVTRLVDIANFVDTTLDYLSGRSAIGFHDIMLDLIENSILYDFLFATDRPEEAVNEPDFFHFVVHRSRITDKNGCYIPINGHYKFYTVAERLDILFCLWVLRDASSVISEIDRQESWRSNPTSMDHYFFSLLPRLEKKLKNFIMLENPITGKNHETTGAERCGEPPKTHISDLASRWVHIWAIAYETLYAYGSDGIIYTQNQVDNEVDLVRKKKAEELAAKIEQLKKEAEQELNAEITKIQHNMPTKRRNKKPGSNG